MKIESTIDLLVGPTTRITIRDTRAGVVLAHVELDAESLAKALGRQAYVPCTAELSNLDKAGKVQEYRHLEIQLPPGTGTLNRKSVARKLAKAQCPDGWEADEYFGSQDSFFRRKDGVEMARTMIRRWVHPEDTQEDLQ